MDDTYFKVFRRLLDDPQWLAEPFTRGQAWVDLIGLANWADGIIRVRGLKIDVKRGQVARAEEWLSDRWGWSRGKVRRFLNELETGQQIVQQKSRKTSIITVVNYDAHQSGSTTNRTTNGQQKDNRKTAAKFTDDVEKMFAFFCKEREVKPKSDANGIDWRHAIRKTIGLDKRDKREMCQLIRWVSQDIEDPRPGSTWTGWRAQIRSPATFRAKYDQLLERSKIEKRSRGAPQSAPKAYKALTASEKAARDKAENAAMLAENDLLGGKT